MFMRMMFAPLAGAPYLSANRSGNTLVKTRLSNFSLIRLLQLLLVPAWLRESLRFQVVRLAWICLIGMLLQGYFVYIMTGYCDLENWLKIRA